ncbi:MAG: enoyl-CoA hydratase [Gammaproteobacteria bacterium]|nr:enoyl-CoA hydratase [Gammaproteobacteria bacterium]
MTASPAPTTTDTAVSYALDNGIATLTLDRPGRYNTLTSEVIAAMSTQLAAIAASSEVRVVIIAATGKAFSTGHDLKEMNAHRDEAFYRRLLADCSRMMQAIVALPQPVIAQVQGIATAAGCQLVASCDLAVAAASARFATNGIANGLYCATPSVALSRVVQRKHALEMLLTGDFIDAARAAEIGLVNHVVDDAELASATRALAQRIAEKSQYAVRLGKASFYRQVNQGLDSAYRGTSEELVCNLLAADGVEGLNAFIEKRAPKWQDR